MSDEAAGPGLPRRRDVVLWLLMVVLPLAALPLLPEQIVIHRDLHGEPDRWVSRWPGVLLLLLIPGVMTLVWLLVRAVGRRAGAESDDPAAVRRAIGRLHTGVLGLMLLLEANFLAESAGWPVPTEAVAVALMGIGFAAMGPQMSDLPKNRWIGVRTPWTLDDDRVWERTHRMAARVFPPGGLLVAAAALLPPPHAMLAGIGLLVVVGLLPVAYSFAIRSDD